MLASGAGQIEKHQQEDINKIANLITSNTQIISKKKLISSYLLNYLMITSTKKIQLLDLHSLLWLILENSGKNMLTVSLGSSSSQNQADSPAALAHIPQLELRLKLCTTVLINLQSAGHVGGSGPCSKASLPLLVCFKAVSSTEHSMGQQFAPWRGILAIHHTLDSSSCLQTVK